MIWLLAAAVVIAVRNTVASATIATTVTVSVATANQNQNKDDDPGAVATTEEVVTHNILTSFPHETGECIAMYCSTVGGFPTAYIPFYVRGKKWLPMKKYEYFLKNRN